MLTIYKNFKININSGLSDASCSFSLSFSFKFLFWKLQFCKNDSTQTSQFFHPTGARSELFTDLTIYLYGGTSADLSKIPPFLRGIVICFRR